jgi:putative ABC transport system permease protein
MNYSNLTRVAFSALKRNKLRAFLTMLGIIIGVASVIAMIAIGQGSKKSIQDQISSMGSNMVFVMPFSQFRGGVQMGNSSSQSLTLKNVEALKNESTAISAISPEVRAGGQAVFGHENWPTTCYGGDKDYLSIKKFEITGGRYFNEKEIQSYAKVCLIGKTVITNLFGKNADPIGQTIRFRKIPLKVIGVLAEKGQNSFGQDQDDLLIAPYTTVQKRVLAITWIQAIFTSAKSEAATQDAINQITDIMRKEHKLKPADQNDFTVMSQSDLIKTFTSISDILTVLLGAIAGISLLVGGIGIMNIMYVSVTERTKEIGLRMSIGGRELDILMQFLIEAILLSVIGGVIGILLGIGATNGISTIMGWPVLISIKSIVLSFLVCAAIGIFFGYYPARKAAKLNPIDAIRYE